ncbi:MAG: hypothetical protein ABIJ31_02155 [Pseudomonadota bacterium]
MKRKILVSVLFITSLIIVGLHTAAMAESALEYNSHTQVSKKRIDRFVYEYSFTVTITNNGQDADAVKATFSINSPYTTIIDSEVTFGNISAGTTVTSTDTYTIQQDRRYPFDTDAVTWSFFSLPPDPGEEGKQTLLGIDSDNDGVRDDIQRYIYFTYPNEEKVRLALTQIAKNFQELLPVSDNPEIAHENVKKLYCSRDCLDYIKGGVRNAMDISRALKAEILNTEERSFAYIEFNNSLAGKTTTMVPFKERKNCCLFDVDNLGDGQ